MPGTSAISERSRKGTKKSEESRRDLPTSLSRDVCMSQSTYATHILTPDVTEKSREAAVPIYSAITAMTKTKSVLVAGCIEYVVTVQLHSFRCLCGCKVSTNL